VVSEIFKIFDPIGLFSPVVIRAKIFMQGLTKEKFKYIKRVANAVTIGMEAIPGRFKNVK